MQPLEPNLPIPEPPSNGIEWRDRRIRDLEDALNSLGRAVTMGSRDDVERAVRQAAYVLRHGG